MNMGEWAATEKQEVKSVHITDEGTFYEVGKLGVTKIEQGEKSGMYANIPYLRVYADEKVIAEMCQHNVVLVVFK